MMTLTRPVKWSDHINFSMAGESTSAERTLRRNSTKPTSSLVFEVVNISLVPQIKKIDPIGGGEVGLILRVINFMVKGIFAVGYVCLSCYSFKIFFLDIVTK